MGGIGEEATRSGVTGSCFLDRRFESVDHLIEGGRETAQLGVGATRLESEVGVAVGDAYCGLDDRGEWAKRSARTLEDEERGKREGGGSDQQLDDEQVVDGVPDARAAGAEGDPRPVREDLIEGEKRSSRLDPR